MKFEVGINPVGIRQAVSDASALAAGGASRISVWDSPSKYSECWTTLGALSQHVHTRPLGVAVTNPVTRHPLVTACAVSALDDAHHAGAYLGIGTGDSGVVNLAESPASLVELEQYISCVRDLLHRGVARWRGRELVLERESGRIPPIYVAAHGPRTLGLAARIADGAIIGIGLDPTSIGLALQAIDGPSATGQRHPELSPLDAWWNVGGIAIDPDEGRAVRRAGWLVAWAAHHLAKSRVQMQSVPASMRADVVDIASSYDVQNHGSLTRQSKGKHSELARRSKAWDYLRDRFIIAGTPDIVGQKLGELRALTVDQIHVGLEVAGLEGTLELLNIPKA